MNSQPDCASSVEVYQLHIRLLTISPMISRRIWVRSDKSLHELHMTLQCVMGWTNERLHHFVIRGIHYNSSRQTLLSDFAFYDRERLLYVYDMFDEWRHEIRLEKRRPLDESGAYPVCVSGRGKTPPEDCGGADRFQDLRDHFNLYYVVGWIAELIAPLLEDEAAELDYDALRQAGYWFTIDKFDCHKANKRLAEYKANRPHNYLGD